MDPLAPEFAWTFKDDDWVRDALEVSYTTYFVIILAFPNEMNCSCAMCVCRCVN